MKRFLIAIAFFLIALVSYSQQLPVSESYMINKYALSPAYAGNSENKTFFCNYRRDWSGLDASPRTLRLSYHDNANDHVGLGARIVIDKFGIFNNFYGMGTYSYKLSSRYYSIIFGLSA